MFTIFTDYATHCSLTTIAGHQNPNKHIWLSIYTVSPLYAERAAEYNTAFGREYVARRFVGVLNLSAPFWCRERAFTALPTITSIGGVHNGR